MSPVTKQGDYRRESLEAGKWLWRVAYSEKETMGPWARGDGDEELGRSWIQNLFSRQFRICPEELNVIYKRNSQRQQIELHNWVIAMPFTEIIKQQETQVW